MRKDKSILWGIIASLLLLGFFIFITSLFQGIEFAFLNLRKLGYLIFPLVIGFGVQIGLWNSIRHDALVNGTAAGSAGISGGAMVACCSHFLINIIPIAGASGIALFLTAYQKWFLGAGILANVLGIGLMLKHKKGMMRNKMKGGDCCK